MNTKISIVMPTYNRAYIIGEALESALRQSYCDYEIIVVDDGSTDNTAEVVRSLRSEKIRYVRHDENRGYSTACNTGISAAAETLVAFLDSDDLWKPEFLERQVDFLSMYPGVDAVFCDVEIEEPSVVIPSLIALMRRFPKLLRESPNGIDYLLGSRQLYLCLLEEIPIKPSALLVKRKVFDSAGLFDPSWPSGTDWDLFLRFSQCCTFGYINEPLVIQRRESDATHQKFREQDKLFLLEVFLREKAKLGKDPEALAAVNRGISNHCSNLAHLYLHCGRRKESVSLYFKGFRETGETMMLLRAASIFMPLGLRDMLRRVVRKTLPHPM
ncbi:MAG: glycosyltransferase family 2 protein [Acidobacteriia bacterium]|nr:glycosyltransferase family 2 protein [Terriglobia bacterium]